MTRSTWHPWLELTTALTILGRVHLALFNRPLIVTSGNDGKHKAGSKPTSTKGGPADARQGPREQRYSLPC